MGPEGITGAEGLEPPLSLRLREGTRRAHAEAEGTPLMRRLARGAVEQASYRGLLVGLFHVYGAMEAAQDRRAGHPIISPLRFTELYRQDALARDLDHFSQGAAPWRGQPPSGATAIYVRRVEEVAEEAPELLVGHLYTRYLGDLSGGQVIRGALRRGMGLAGDEGTAFYSFAGIPDVRRFKALYRERLDRLAIDEGTAARIVEEANRAFTLNMRLFEELERPG